MDDSPLLDHFPGDGGHRVKVLPLLAWGQSWQVQGNPRRRLEQKEMAMDLVKISQIGEINVNLFNYLKTKAGYNKIR